MTPERRRELALIHRTKDCGKVWEEFGECLDEIELLNRAGERIAAELRNAKGANEIIRAEMRWRIKRLFGKKPETSPTDPSLCRDCGGKLGATAFLKGSTLSDGYLCDRCNRRSGPRRDRERTD